MNDDYEEFINSKRKTAIKSGFTPKHLNPKLKDHQRFSVIKACESGRFGLFLGTGLGKTLVQLDWSHNVCLETSGSVLILAPLAVVGQTKNVEAKKWGYDVELWRNNITEPKGIYITNYDQLENIDVSVFDGVVLDESSILKSINGQKKTMIIDKFRSTPYKLACSATPSPNDHMELGNHSEFLGQMSYSEMLAMFFVHDGGETSKWRLRKHAEKDFWNYVLSWSIAMDHPATFGFDANEYTLPNVHYIEHLIDVDSNGLDLFGEAIVSATELHPVLRATQDARLQKAVEVFNEKPNEQWIFWCIQNEEAKQLQKLIPKSCNVQGSDKAEVKADKLNGFIIGDPKDLITKTSIASFGMNYQHANHMLFTSYDFSFEKFYQAVRRMLRFGQLNDVFVHILTPKNQINVIGKIKESQKKHEEKIKQLAKMSSEHENTDINKLTFEDVITDDFKCLIGDCVTRSKDISDDELDLVVFSPPFSELYVYSDKIEDMGNSSNYKEFEKHFKYLIPQIKRTLKSGRICAVHCMDLPIQKGKEGFIGLRDFSGMITKWFLDEGFIYHSRVTIWKNPVTEMQRTKALGLLHKTIKKDSSMSRVGIPDYVLFFRNEGKNEIPIKHYGDLTQCIDACKIDKSLDLEVEKLRILPVDLWQKYASPVWYDVNYSRTLQYTTARDSNDEKHICPLQLDTIERVIHLYSNPNETVGSFFGGIGSEGFKALKMLRKSVSIELKESYFKVNVQNHKNAVLQNSELKLF